MSRADGKLTAPARADGRLSPIRELDAAACQALVGVVFDVDDTVTRGGRSVLQS
jgi:hypothetical protein